MKHGFAYIMSLQRGLYVVMQANIFEYVKIARLVFELALLCLILTWKDKTRQYRWT